MHFILLLKVKLSLCLFLLNSKTGSIPKDTTKTLKFQGLLLWRSSHPTSQLEQDVLEPVVQCVPVTSCPVTETSLALSFLHPSLRYLCTLVSFPPQFLRAKQAQLSQPFLVGQMLQSLQHDQGPLLIPLQGLCISKHSSPDVTLPVLSRVYWYQVEETRKIICSWIREKKLGKVSSKYFTLELEDLPLFS